MCQFVLLREWLYNPELFFFDQGYSQRKDLVVCTPDKRMRNYVTVIANTEFAIVRVVPDSILRRDIDDRR